MTASQIVYATDEDVVLRAAADFAILCPRDQSLAYGTDGSLGADRWTLSSSQVDFLANGLMPGQLVRLTQPLGLFKPPGEVFVVATVGPSGVILRRKGQAVGAGQPAGPIGGVSQVEFQVTSLGPQLARASYDLDRRFGINALLAGRRSADLFDPNEVREATVLTVLYRQYLEISRGGQDKVDVFAMKSQMYKQELDDLLARTVVHWAASPGNPTNVPSTSRLGTRISR